MSGTRTTDKSDRASRRARRLLLTAVVVMSLPLLIAIFALQRAQSEQRAAAGQAQLALARAIAGQIEAALEAARDGLRSIAAQPSLAGHVLERDADRAVALFDAVQVSTRFYRAFAVLDAEHKLLAVHPLPELDVFDAATASLDPLVVQRGVGADAVVIVREPVVDTGGQRVGAVLAAISLDRILGTIERTRFGDTGAASVIDRAANVVVSADPLRKGQRLRATPVVALARSGGEDVLAYRAPLLQRREFSALTPVPGYALSVLVSQAEAETFAAITLFERALLGVLVLLTLGGGALFLYALSAYRSYERRIQASNTLFTAVTEGTNDVVFVKGRDGRYLLINSAGARVVGRNVEDVLGRTDFDLHDATTARRIRTADLAVIESGELAAGEFPVPDGVSGAERLFSTVRAPYRDEAGRVIGLIGVARDITAEHESEQTIRRQTAELARANTLLAAVVENSTDVVYVKDREERYLLMNEAGAGAVGAPLAQVIGRRIDELIAPEEGNPIRARDQQVLAEGRTVTGEYEVHVDGVLRTFLSVVSPWRDASGRVVGLVGISRDITDRKHAERTIAHQAEELAQTNALLKGVVEGSPDAIFVKDLEGVYVMMNRIGASWFGRQPEAIIGVTDLELFGQAVATHLRSAELEVVATGKPLLFVEQLELPGGARWLQFAKAPLRDYDGTVTGVLCIARDVTDVERARLALAASEKRHRDLFEMSKGLICVHDLEGTLITVNPASAAILGYLPGEIEGRNLQEFVPPDYREAFARYLAGFERTNEQQGVLVLVARSGEYRYLQFTNHLYAEPGRAPYVIGHANDITERRRYEQKLREMSFSDPLTGLYNRRYLAHREQAARPGTRFGAIVIDLDKFKLINDTWGHQRGDEVLIGIGQFLQRHARRGDAVIRMGGDEFLVLLEGADEAIARGMVERIEADAPNAPCGFSIGHAVREGDESLEKTIDRADLTLYRIRVETRGYERRKH